MFTWIAEGYESFLRVAVPLRGFDVRVHHITVILPLGTTVFRVRNNRLEDQ